MFLEDQIKAIGAMECSVIEKAGMMGKALIDYGRDQAAGGSVELQIFGFTIGRLNFNFPQVKKAEPAK